MLTRDVIDQARLAFPLFSRLEPESLDEVIRDSDEAKLAAGAVMFNAGDGCEAFGFVVDGSVKVSLQSASGRGLVLYRVGQGESCTVTVSCLISNTPYPATGVVEEALRAVVLPKAAFNRQMERSRVFRSFVLEVFSSRVIHLMRLINEVAFNKLDHRLVGRLIELGPVINMSHQELADELGTTREIVSRILESLADDGAVSLGRRRIEVTRSELLLERRA